MEKYTRTLVFFFLFCIVCPFSFSAEKAKESKGTKNAELPQDPNPDRANNTNKIQTVVSPEETPGIEVFLVDETESPSSQYTLSQDLNAAKELRFKRSITFKTPYISWAIEFSDPLRNLSRRIASDGKMPETVRWDGTFDSNQSIIPRSRYYYRLILVSEDEKLYSSPWTSFSVRLKNRSEGAKTKEKFISLYVAPTIGFESQSINTKSFSDTGMALLGDLKFILNDTHIFALKYEASSDSLFQSTTAANDLNYSDFSFYYRYNITGRPLKAGTMEKDKFVAQMGARSFASVVRGGGNLPVDGEAARSYQGLTGTLNLEQRIGNFRLLEGAEAGYSLFKSKHTIIGFEGALTYEGFKYVGIGIHGKYSMVDGKPEADANDAGNGGNTTISNKILMAGLSLYFKI